MSPRPLEFSDSQFEAALQLARSGRSQEALGQIERTLALAGDRGPVATAAAGALAEVARHASRSEDLKTAERALNVALDLRPGYADLHFQHACTLLASRRRREARRSLETALRLNPRYVAARVELALLDARDGLIGEALDSLRALAREEPVEDVRIFEQGLKSLERADWDAADALLKRAVRLVDADFQNRLERFHLLIQQNELVQATNVLREALPRYQGYPDLHYLLGSVELRRGHFDDAIVALARALELNPDFHSARVQFARALECQGQSAAAAEQLTLVLGSDPNHHEAHELRRSLLSRTFHPEPESGPRRHAA